MGEELVLGGNLSREMVFGVATRGWQGFAACVETWQATASKRYQEFYAIDMDIVPALQYIYEKTTEPIIAYIHDDVNIFEKYWDLRVLKEFEDPTVGMVGFGGALRHGSKDLYRIPYQLQQLGRSHFMSNLRNAEEHGVRFSGEADAAVFDGFAIFIRRAILDKIGGWPKRSGYFMYCEAISCEARRQGYRLRLVGVDCEHLSGKTASMVQVTDSHPEAHVWLYNKYRDCLPFAVGGA